MASSNRTEKPTPKHRREGIKKGELARSKEIPAALTFLAAFFFLAVAGADSLDQLESFARFFWRTFLTQEVTLETAPGIVRHCLWGAVRLAAPFLALTLCVSLGGSAIQGVALSTYRLQFRVEALNPASNLKKVFSSKGLAEFAKSTVVILMVGYLVGSVVQERLPALENTVSMELRDILSELGAALYAAGFRVGIFLAVMAIADYVFQRYRHEEGLKQSKQEVRDDLKETEGNPLIRSRIRTLQREMARKRMMSDVKDADVVITNPTEYAVALKYDLANMSAPRVVGKGRGYVAAKIKEIARQYNVITVENIALAQALYKSVEVGSEIPASLYRAVAQILAYVYKLKQTHWH